MLSSCREFASNLIGDMRMRLAIASLVLGLPLEKEAGSRFLEQVLRKKDEAFLLSFDDNVDLLQDFTNSAHLLSRAMSKAEINTAGGNGAAGIPGAGGGTIPTIGDPKGTLL